MTRLTFTLSDRMCRLLPVFLLVSLAANMFLLGLVVSHHGPPPFGPPDPRRFVERVARELPSEDARILWKVYEDLRPVLDTRLGREPHRNLHRIIEEALLSEPFNPEGLIQRLAENDQEEHAFHRLVERHVIAAVATMSPEGRRRLARVHP
jgi:uncharacterized membrane protein